MLISLVTPSVGGVSQRSQYHGAVLTSGYIHSAQGSHFWSLLATRYASFVTAFCLAAHSGRLLVLLTPTNVGWRADSNPTPGPHSKINYDYYSISQSLPHSPTLLHDVSQHCKPRREKQEESDWSSSVSKLYPQRVPRRLVCDYGGIRCWRSVWRVKSASMLGE